MSSVSDPYETGLERTPANYVPLSPISLVERAGAVFPNRTSVIYDGRTHTWSETLDRCRRFASHLARMGVGRGDTVATMLPNVPAMIEAHFAVPMAGAVINTLNTRLEPASLAFMLDHGGAKVLLVDPDLAGVIVEALALMRGPRPRIVDVFDPAADGAARIGEIEYEDAVAAGDPAFEALTPRDEWDAIALSYTSGTTGDPKGVVTHHRGAYLNAVSNVLAGEMGSHPVYLWTLPLFHCNGWCFAWTMAATAGTSVCLRKVDPARICELVGRHAVTHLAGAPIVYAMIVGSPEAAAGKLGRSLTGLVAGAPPSPAILADAERVGIRLVHVYGLTEVYGPAAICAEQDGWDALSVEQRAYLRRRQGVPYPLQEAVTVLDPETMAPVPRDGRTIGEIMFRGNIVMKGYLKDAAATEKAFAGGWFHTGDLGVLDEDGYVIIKDRLKDIIISGGENVSSVEVEEVLAAHPDVLLAAVVAKPDERWGEVPCAFVELKPGRATSVRDMDVHCRDRLPGFKAPKEFVFGELPRTSTGKVQKYRLRQRVIPSDRPDVVLRSG